METITTVGIDLAKNVFQVHAVDAQGQVVVSKAVRRAALLLLLSKVRPCLVGMEACASSAPLGAGVDRAGPPCAADPTGLCEGLCAPAVPAR